MMQMKVQMSIVCGRNYQQSQIRYALTPNKEILGGIPYLGVASHKHERLKTLASPNGTDAPLNYSMITFAITESISWTSNFHMISV